MSFFRRVFFNLWYFRNPPWDTGISPPELIDFISSTPPGRALDLGCGTGTNVITLAQNGWEATGVDFAAKAIRSAQHKARQAGVKAKFYTGDVTRLEGITGPFDLALDIGCFHSLVAPGRQRYIQNLTRLLASGGTYLLYAFINQEDEQGNGIFQGDLNDIAYHLQLIWRKDGNDRGRGRRSAWTRWERMMPVKGTGAEG